MIQFQFHHVGNFKSNGNLLFEFLKTRFRESENKPTLLFTGSCGGTINQWKIDYHPKSDQFKDLLHLKSIKITVGMGNSEGRHFTYDKQENELVLTDDSSRLCVWNLNQQNPQKTIIRTDAALGNEIWFNCKQTNKKFLILHLCTGVAIMDWKTKEIVKKLPVHFSLVNLVVDDNSQQLYVIHKKLIQLWCLKSYEQLHIRNPCYAFEDIQDFCFLNQEKTKFATCDSIGVLNFGLKKIPNILP